MAENGFSGVSRMAVDNERPRGTSIFNPDPRRGNRSAMSAEAPAPRPLMIYNTQSRTKEPFAPLVPGKVCMYNCGPTVYDYFHVGNARNFVCADIIRRYLAYRGYQVTFVQNITDIDDKIIKRANEAGCPASEIAERYTKVFFESSAKLGVRPADHHPRATQYVGKMIAMVRKLEKAGYAYTSEGDVYFRVQKFAEYGKLSGRKIEDLLSGARVEVSEKKEHPADFVLWKAAKEGEPSWPSPWGPGRPGWHLECSVMSIDLLGETFDIHMGGADLVFPHHENEIAQSEAATGKPFVHYWMHNGFLNINGEKMSKSLGNFFTIDEVLAKFEAPIVRYFLLSAHYHAPLDFSDTALAEAATALGRLREARRAARRLTGNRRPFGKTTVFSIYDRFEAAMDDDFNTPRALAVLFDIATQINELDNKATRRQLQHETLSEEDIEEVARFAEALDVLGGETLGLELEPPEAAIEHLRGPLAELFESLCKEYPQTASLTDSEAGTGERATQEILQRLIALRAAARKEKNWAAADRVRVGLSELGFELLDRPTGTEWRRV
jgi:cysteinyl-tRNA synthetase